MTPANLNPKTLKKLKTLSNLLDNAIAIPGTKYKIGLDPILGLFPAVGDYLSLFISAYIIFEASKLGAKQETLVKMAVNLLVDSLVGTVPVAGDIFDVAWKANQKNIELLEQDLPDPKTPAAPEPTTATPVDWKPIILIFGAILLIISLSIFVTVKLLAALFSLLGF